MSTRAAGISTQALRDEFTWFGLTLLLGGIAYGFARGRLTTSALLLCGAVACRSRSLPDETDLGRSVTSFVSESSSRCDRRRRQVASWSRRRAAGAAAIAVALVATQQNYFHQPTTIAPVT